MLPAILHKISRWGYHHQRLSRWLIAVAHVLAALNALFLGTLLYYEDVLIPAWVKLLFLPLLLVSYLFYPKYGSLNYHYLKQKMHDAAFIVVFTLFLLVHANSVLQAHYIPELSIKAVAIKVSSGTKTLPEEQSTAIAKKSYWQQIKQQRSTVIKALKEAKQHYKHVNRNDGGGFARFTLIFLSVVAALFLVLMVAGLACSIACSGQEALALVVLLSGLAGVVLLSVFVIRAIVKYVGRGLQEQKRQQTDADA
jgi:hypothetical protein